MIKASHISESFPTVRTAVCGVVLRAIQGSRTHSACLSRDVIVLGKEFGDFRGGTVGVGLFATWTEVATAITTPARTRVLSRQSDTHLAEDKLRADAALSLLLANFPVKRRSLLASSMRE